MLNKILNIDRRALMFLTSLYLFILSQIDGLDLGRTLWKALSAAWLCPVVQESQDTDLWRVLVWIDQNLQMFNYFQVYIDKISFTVKACFLEA